MSNLTSQSVADIDIPIMLFDGGSIGNPPKTAASAILLMPNGRRYTVSHFLFLATEIEAQYTGLIIGLRKAKQLGIKAIEVKGSSQWIANYEENGQQFQNHEILRLLYRETQLLIQSFQKISLEWIPAEQNRSAMTAISRCIGESLSMESKKAIKTGKQEISPTILNFRRLGKQLSLEDYELLKSEIDDLTFKPLAQLELLVPKIVLETVTSQWKGNPLEISEVYRWYLRGLSPEMALRKATLDAEMAVQKLKSKRIQESLSPPTINIETTLYEEPSPVIETDLPLIEVDNTKTHFSPGYIDFDGTGVNDKETYICDSDLEWAVSTVDEKETLIVEDEKETLIVEDEKETLIVDGKSLSSFSNTEIALLSEKKNEPLKEKVNIPRRDRVNDILDSISRLSLYEKTYLSKELLNSPDLVYLILKAITDKLT